MLELTDKAMAFVLTLLFILDVCCWILWGLDRYSHHTNTTNTTKLRWYHWADIILPPPLGWMIYWCASAARRARRR